MIKSKEDFLFYLEADRIANSKPKKVKFGQKVKNFLSPDYLWQFHKTLRKYEYYKNCRKDFIGKLVSLFIGEKFKKLSYKLGFSIPINIFGPGLSIAHYGTIIINHKAKVGANCRIHACVNIGTEAGYKSRAPKIGDNCYIGPGVKMYGDITIADNVAIGANAVVNKSIEESNIAIGGVPAKKIADINIYDLLIPADLIIKRGLNDEDISNIPSKELKEKLNL